MNEYSQFRHSVVRLIQLYTCKSAWILRQVKPCFWAIVGWFYQDLGHWIFQRCIKLFNNSYAYSHLRIVQACQKAIQISFCQKTISALELLSLVRVFFIVVQYKNKLACLYKWMMLSTTIIKQNNTPSKSSLPNIGLQRQKTKTRPISTWYYCLVTESKCRWVKYKRFKHATVVNGLCYLLGRQFHSSCCCRSYGNLRNRHHPISPAGFGSC